MIYNDYPKPILDHVSLPQRYKKVIKDLLESTYDDKDFKLLVDIPWQLQSSDLLYHIQKNYIVHRVYFKLGNRVFCEDHRSGLVVRLPMVLYRTFKDKREINVRYIPETFREMILSFDVNTKHLGMQFYITSLK